jgi:hypothetical protein
MWYSAGVENASTEHLGKLMDVFRRVSKVSFADVFPNGETNPNKIKDGMMKARMKAVKE